MKRKSMRPGYLRNLGDTWTHIEEEQNLDRDETNKLETLSRDSLSTESGSARGGPLLNVPSRSAARLSSPDFLMKNAKWYRDYMRKIMQNTSE